MKCFSRLLVVLFALITLSLSALLSPSAHGGIEIDVYPSLAPNQFGSPNFMGWEDNALYALDHQQNSGGTAGTPAFYSQSSGQLQIHDNIVTDFNSWRGDANPAADYGAAYANEFGTRITFSLAIFGSGGTEFSISQMSFIGTSSNGQLNTSYAAGLFNYGPDSYWGILYGADGKLGGGDDTIITSGANTQMVDAIVGRGVGNAYQASSSDPGATNQQKIDNVVAQISPYSYTGQYFIPGASGSGTIMFVPEPSTVWLLGLGALLAVVLSFLRRRA
jgi:hypothetical protein